jgi:membrane protease YdiL (CAAX protease family)
MTPAAYAAAGLEIGMALCGLALILWLMFSARARPALAIRLPAWNLPPVDFACFMFFVFLGATALSAAAALVLRHVHLGSDAEMVTGSAVMEAGILLGLAGYHFMFRGRPRADAGASAVPRALKSGIITFLVAAPLVDGTSVVWEYILGKAGLPQEKQDMVGILENTNSPRVKWGLVATAVILVPIAEEAVFRGGLFRYFRTRVPRWAAIALTSALFGALHVHWGGQFEGLPSLAPLIVLAAVFCVAYERTGLIGTTIVAHALFNLNTFVLVVSGIGT